MIGRARGQIVAHPFEPLARNVEKLRRARQYFFRVSNCSLNDLIYLVHYPRTRNAIFGLGRRNAGAG